VTEALPGAARPHDRYPPGRPGAGHPGDRRGEQGLAADRWLTVIEDLPEEHTGLYRRGALREGVGRRRGAAA
jgi:hypothetical protein